MSKANMHEILKPENFGSADEK